MSSMYHHHHHHHSSTMHMEESAAPAYNQHPYAQYQQWPGFTASDREPLRPESRFTAPRGDHFDYHQTSSSGHFDYSHSPRSHHREAEPADGHYYQWPAHRGGAGAPADATPLSPGNMSAPPSPGEECHGWMNGETGERTTCHCGKAFRRPSDLAKHQKYHIKYFSCLFSGCEKAFATQKDLSRHARTHRKGEGYRCNVDGCRKAAAGHIYSRKDNFDRHMRTAHPEL